MARLRDVADVAGVSVTTASRVLNGADASHPVSPEVRAAVTAAAEQLGYRPSATARALKQGRSDLIGVIVSDILDPYFGELTRGIEIASAAAGFVTVSANGNRDPEQELTRFRALRQHGAAGIVFCGSDIDGAPGTAALAREVNRAIREGTRVVSLAPRGFTSAQIVVDNTATSAHLTAHLIGTGARDIVFVGGIPGLAAADERISGYRSTMYERGLKPHVVGLDGMNQTAGRDVVATILAGATTPDAFLCTNDETAVGAIAALWNAGVDVPGDVAIASIGGTAGGRIFDLTAVELPLGELGRLAVEYVADDTDRVPDAPVATLRIGRTTRERTD
ncbi:LacI family transcriptional regulator [Pseudoclavibacter chungangensis]|nr:LacI family DNA-binding transcriptional regulator [Pseudoclavibacter chungangensis]NYJ66063.1 LacI family transcriptional regulator [Pseudoclavibacter chungangensis]